MLNMQVKLDPIINYAVNAPSMAGIAHPWSKCYIVDLLNERLLTKSLTISNYTACYPLLNK